MTEDPKITELTVSQLQRLIRETVQEAVAEVIVEFSAAAEAEEQMQFEAEMADYMRSTMQQMQRRGLASGVHLDD